MENPIVQINSLRKYFPLSKHGLLNKKTVHVKAVDGIHLEIRKGETVGLVGESGCGKTTVGRLLLGLEKPTSGQICFSGLDLSKLNGKQLRQMRKEMQMIFQNPFSSLNPRIKIGRTLETPLINFSNLSVKERKEKVKELLELVGLEGEFTERYPHEFSGGQRQRIVIARALASEPKLIVADEPISALDVSIQAQIINLLKDLQETFRLTYLFITHDLRVVHYISDRIAVMYLGKIVEIAATQELFSSPLHPYSLKLLAASPVPDPKIESKREIADMLLKGEVSSPINVPSGCRFHARCDHVVNICIKTEPELTNLGNDHYIACHLVQ